MDNQTIPVISHIHIKQFRCFKEHTITCDAPLVLIQGANGTGKTSIVEALYYACYLRSFRTNTPRELVTDNTDAFCVKVMVRTSDQTDEISIGFSDKKRLVKINQQAISSYKSLLSYYRVIAITEDDIDLIKEGPSYRRDFLDQALTLVDATYITAFKRMRDTLEQRNKVLQTGACDPDLYAVWTQQLWERSIPLQKQRIQLLKEIQKEVNCLIQIYFASEFKVSFFYEPKKMDVHQSFEAFQQENPTLYQDELRFRRSLFGAHVDTINITFKGKKSRSFASRGQQKLLVILIKAAQIRLLAGLSHTPLILLLDDFMTDFDSDRANTLIQLLQDLHIQLIFTAPLGGYLEQELEKRGAYMVKLSL